MSKLCECGCGRFTSIAKYTINKRGQIKGEPVRFIHGHSGSLKGINNPAFNWGFTKHSDGRVAVRTRDKGNIFWYRVVMENILFDKTGKYRALSSKEAVHHENENYLDHSLNNLRLKARGVHSIEHSKGKPRPWARETHSKSVFLYKENCFIVQQFDSAKEGSLFLGFHPNTLSQYIREGRMIKGWKAQYLE